MSPNFSLDGFMDMDRGNIREYLAELRRDPLVLIIQPIPELVIFLIEVIG
jgi:hypothetical protein